MGDNGAFGDAIDGGVRRRVFRDTDLAGEESW
jgi:hypothetical protein